MPHLSAVPAAPRPPLDLAKLTRVQQPALRWAEPLGKITPARVHQMLTAANAGDSEAYLTLAAEAEERYGHFASVIQTRKLAVCGENIEVSPGDKSELAQQVADAFREHVVDQTCFHDLLLDLSDGVSKGYSVVQPHWDFETTPWVYREFEWLDPRYFVFDRNHLTKIRLRSEGRPDGIELAPGQVIYHRPRTRSGIPLRTGLIRPVSIAWMFQGSSVSQWSAFAEVFGMPLRIGKYNPESASDHEIEQLRLALINLGHDAAGIIPNTMDLEVLDARRPTSGNNVFEGIADYWDRVTSKIVLGGTMTSEAGSSLAQAKVHDEVRLDLKRSDARALEGTVHAQVAAPWTLYNYGPFAPVPKIRLAVDPPEDLAAFSSAVAPLIKAGLRVSAAEVRAKFGLRDPEPDEEVIELATAPESMEPAL